MSGLTSTDSTADGNSNKNLVLLTSENYDEWAPRMEDHLARRKLWWTVDKVQTLPETTDERATFNDWNIGQYRYRWREDCDDAIRAMKAYCDPARREEVDSLTEQDLTPAKLWRHLKKLYQKVDTDSYVKAWRELLTIKITEDPSMEDLRKDLDKFNQTADKIVRMGVGIDKILTTLLLLATPKSYSTLVDVLIEQKDLTRASTTQKLLGKCSRDASTPKTQALVTKPRHRDTRDRDRYRDRDHTRKKQKRDDGGRQGGSKSNNSKDSDIPKCDFCTKAHHVSNCWKKHPEKMPDNIKAIVKEKAQSRGFSVGPKNN